METVVATSNTERAIIRHIYLTEFCTLKNQNHKTMKTTFLLLFVFFFCSATAQIVNIPDPIFKQRIIDNGVDTNFDGEIQYSEAEAVTGALDVNGQFDDIFDLTGIEAFVNITELYCQLNALTTLDLSQNTVLVHLECWENPLTSLNVT